MQSNKIKSIKGQSRQSKADSINSDLRNITIVKRNSSNSSNDSSVNKKQQNPSYQSCDSVLTYVHTVKQAFGQLSTIRFFQPRPSLLKMPQGNYLSLSQSKYRNDEEYRLKMSYNIVAFTFILLQILNVSDMTDNQYQKYKLIRSLIRRGRKILASLPKIKDTFYQHSHYLSIVLRYQMQDVFRSDPNLVYKIHHLPQKQQSSRSLIKLDKKSKIRDLLYFRQFDREYLEELLNKLELKNKFKYFQIKVKNAKPKQNIFEYYEHHTEQQIEIKTPQYTNSTKQNQLNTSIVVKYNYLTKQYKNPFNNSQYSFFKYPSILINLINLKIHSSYQQKSTVKLKDSLKQNIKLITLVVSFFVLNFCLILIISNKIAKYAIIGILTLILLAIYIYWSSQMQIFNSLLLREHIDSLLTQQSKTMQFKYQFINQFAFDIRVTKINL